MRRLIVKSRRRTRTPAPSSEIVCPRPQSPPTIGSRTIGLLYVTIFGIGSIGGMILMSFLVGLPFHFTAVRFHRFNHLLQGVAGLVSISLGFWIVYEMGFSGGLFA